MVAQQKETGLVTGVGSDHRGLGESSGEAKICH